jgi:hypothetical protein
MKAAASYFHRAGAGQVRARRPDDGGGGGGGTGRLAPLRSFKRVIRGLRLRARRPRLGLRCAPGQIGQGAVPPGRPRRCLRRLPMVG